MLLLALVGCGGVNPAADVDVWPVALRAQGALRVMVLDASGRPVGGAWVTVSPGGFEGQTDAQGVVVLERLVPGPSTVYAAAQGVRSAQEVDVPELDPGADDTGLLDVELVLPEVPLAGALATVAVAGPGGLPLSGVQVSAGAVSTVTDAAGQAVLVGFEGPDVVVSVRDPEGRVADADLGVGTLGAAEGVQWSMQLSGRVHDGARFLGSAACAGCHGDQHDAWLQTAHAQALTAAAGPDVEAVFLAGQSLDSGGLTVSAVVDNDDLVIVLGDGLGGVQRWTVAGWIGRPAHAAVPWADDDGVAWALPLVWRGGDSSRTGHPDAQPGFVARDTDRWLDDTGRLQRPPVAESAEAQCFGCHATGFVLDPQDDGGVEMVATRGEDRWQEGAVACEACHGPGSEHRRLAAEGGQQVIVNPGHLDQQRALDSCGACHGATEAHGRPFAGRGEGGFEPGELLADHTVSDAVRWPGGTAAGPHQQSDEHGDAGHGAAGLDCNTCHAVHGATGSLRASATDNTLCLACHSDHDEDSGHLAHVRIDPEGLTEGGRCIGCHMPGTATESGWGTLSGAGSLGTHTFWALAPQETVDVFGESEVLDLGAFPAHACADCHAWNGWRFGESGVDFPGADGDPTLRATHEAHQESFLEKYP